MKAETKRTAELSEKDIQEAIAYWLTNVADMDNLYCAENVQISVKPLSPEGFALSFEAFAVASGADKG